MSTDAPHRQSEPPLRLLLPPILIAMLVAATTGLLSGRRSFYVLSAAYAAAAFVISAAWRRAVPKLQALSFSFLLTGALMLPFGALLPEAGSAPGGTITLAGRGPILWLSFCFLAAGAILALRGPKGRS